MAHLEYFPQARIRLDREIARPEHHELQSLLANHPADEFEIRLAEISSYCGVILDGDYTPLDLDGLCKLLYEKLVKKRTGIILDVRSS